MFVAVDAYKDNDVAFDAMALEIPKNLSPGTALRRAREAMGASIHDVSRPPAFPNATWKPSNGPIIAFFGRVCTRLGFPAVMHAMSG